MCDAVTIALLVGADAVICILAGATGDTSAENASGLREASNQMTAGAHDDTDWDPEHPDLQHEPPEVCSEDPVDFEPGEGETDGGELPAEIPDAES